MSLIYFPEQSIPIKSILSQYIVEFYIFFLSLPPTGSKQSTSLPYPVPTLHLCTLSTFNTRSNLLYVFQSLFVVFSASFIVSSVLVRTNPYVLQNMLYKPIFSLSSWLHKLGFPRLSRTASFLIL